MSWSEAVVDKYGAVRTTYDQEGNVVDVERVVSISQSVSNLMDALTLLQAIKSGQPLPIVTSGLKLVNGIANPLGQNNVPELNAATNIAGGILSLMSLDKALQNGDVLAATYATAQTVNYGVNAYLSIADTSTAGFAVAQDISTLLNGTPSVVGNAPGVLPVLGLIMSIRNGDAAGIAVSGLAVLNSMGAFAASQAVAYAIPYIGWAYAIYSLITSLFGDDDIPPTWGNGQFIWDGYGISTTAAGEQGGDQMVTNVMNATLQTLNALIEQVRVQNPGSQLGIIPNRMPNVAADPSGLRYVDIDPITGVEKHPDLRFDTSGKPFNAPVGSPESHLSMIQGMAMSALAREAIAPIWEVQTAKMQTDAGDPRAGLSELERAGRDGELAAPVTGSTQTFRPVVLDLDGDGIEVMGKADGVAFNVDDSGYLKQTGWVKGDDGFLVLDRNYNGQYDSGKELFSNAAIALGKRGLASMGWLDANYDGRITSTDPVWNELKVWRDLNKDGLQENGELVGLNAQGITELNYSLGTFTRSGQVLQMASPDLEADKDGTQIKVVSEGILMRASSDGKMTLVVTRVDDRTAVQANRDGITGYEDIELIVSPTDLLANDTMGGISGQQLTVTGISNFRHGSGFVDANGMIHFTPEANYVGNEAGFDYSVLASNGQTATNGVDITLQNINDAPTATDQRVYRPIYGYTTQTVPSNSDAPPTTIQVPIYQPYGIVYVDQWQDGYVTVPVTVYDPAPGIAGMEYHVTPIAKEDSGNGFVIGNDIDDPASSLTYSIEGNPQYGAVTVDKFTGQYVYTSWSAPNVPGSVSDGDPFMSIYPGTDAFTVKVTDPQGASSVMTVTVPHPGGYTPPTPPGGGGGCCPIAVDLDSNGFQFTSVDDSNVFFDINADGWKRKVAWTKPGNGWLAYDANANGKVDDGTEMVFTKYAQTAQGDLQSVAEAFDTNHDGKLSAADEKWAKFGVWHDVNQNGLTDANEFKTLNEMDVVSVDLVSDGTFSSIDGAAIHGISKMTFADGHTINIADAAIASSSQVQTMQPDGSTTVTTHTPFSGGTSEINGTEDNDLILGQAGSDVIKGLAGNDVVFDDGGNDIIEGGDGTDQIYSGADNDLVMGGAGDDTVYAGFGNDMVFGGDGNDLLMGEGGNDVIFAGVGNDIVSGGAGNDVLSGDDGDDVLSGETGNDALFGGKGDDQLLGGDDHDLLVGGDGNDLLDGGSGIDVMQGGAGNDTYIVESSTDAVDETTDGRIDGTSGTLDAGGIDTVRASIDYTLGDFLENLTLTGTSANRGTGNALDNVLIGNIADNILSGDAGNDTLNGGAGADTLIGGAGDDTYIVDNVNDIVQENPWEGADTVKAIISHTLADNVENLILIGVAAINATGNSAENSLTGNSAANILDGGAGADIMAGGAGNDTYIVDNAQDVVQEAMSQGIDTVRSSVNYTLSASVENLTLTGTALEGAGNELDNTIRANDLGNTLSGLAGNDTLIGGAGSDMLDGGSGVDQMAGGQGNDTYIVDSSNDVVVERADEGADLVVASENYTLSANVENLALAGAALEGTGNELDNTIRANDLGNTLSALGGNDILIGGLGADILMGGDGNDSLQGYAGTDLLDGGSGADQMTGGQGNDGYIVDNVGDVVNEFASEGQDLVNATVNYTLTANVEDLTLMGPATEGTGNELDNTIRANDLGNTLSGLAGNDTLVGGTGSDTLLGGNGNDSLQGNAGNDLLDGGTGADQMAGGQGDEHYVVDNTGDLVVEAAGEGIDHVLSSIDYTLATNVENLTLTGSATQGTGNELDNVIVGDNLGNTLSGLAGSDTLSGGTGADTLLGGEGNDSLQGNSGNDILDGGMGADGMYGGSGDDLYIVDNAADVVGEGSNSGNDTIYSSVNYITADAVENLILTGNAQGGSGNALNNVLVGNAGNNTLSGGAGDDLLAGWLGDDMLDGGIGNDAYLWNQGDGRDTLVDVSGTDTVRFGTGITVENLAAREYVVNGEHRIYIALLDQYGEERQDQGIDFALVAQTVTTVTYNGSGQPNGTVTKTVYVSPIEAFILADGTQLTLDQLRPPAASLTGTNSTETLTGSRADDVIYALAGEDTLYGRTGNDYLSGDGGNDKLFGEGGNDTLYGGAGNDWIQGGSGKDVLYGDNGVDTVLGGKGNDELHGGGGDHDLLDGGAGDDKLYAESAYDSLYGAEGNDLLDGAGGTALLAGGAGNDVLQARSGLNVVLGGSGADAITGGSNNDFIDAGSGSDIINGDAGSDFIVGGKGNDSIRGGMASDVIGFNRGDGQDTLLMNEWYGDTLSLGAGIRYSDLMLSRNGNDLVLRMGGTDQITMQGWYSGIAKGVGFLQVMTEGGDYAATSTNRLFNTKEVYFDFQKIVAAFEQACQLDPSQANGWAAAPSLDASYIAGSNTAAIGGAFAYRYATLNSAATELANYGNLSVVDIQGMLPSLSGRPIQFTGTGSATVNPWTALQAGLSLIAEQPTGASTIIVPSDPLSQEALIASAMIAQESRTGQPKPAWQ